MVAIARVNEKRGVGYWQGWRNLPAQCRLYFHWFSRSKILIIISRSKIILLIRYLSIIDEKTFLETAGHKEIPVQGRKLKRSYF